MRLAFPGLMAALAERVTLVTPSPLLASVAVEQFHREQLALGHEAWERPSTYSLDAWMANCWQQARFAVPNAPSLLSPPQERELWRQIIASDRPDLFDLRAMAGLAQRASRVLAEYQIPTEGTAWTEHPDAQEFLRWHQRMQTRLKDENWITWSALWNLIPAWIRKGVVSAEGVTFAALTSVSPGLKRFEGRTVGITPSFAAATGTAVSFESVTHEMEHVARAARRLVEDDGVRSVGILVVDLKSHARDMTRILREVFYPSSSDDILVHAETGHLLAHPLISNALLLLELAQSRIHHASAGAILRSPFIEGAAKERSARALADNYLRKARELDFSLADIENAAARCPLLKAVFQRLRKVIAKVRPVMRMPDWSEAFADILEVANWPALNGISEAERQAVEQWKRGLSELASLGLVTPPGSHSQAVTHLCAILSRPSEQGSWSSPVQVIDANSAGGIEFDHAFVVNASETAWPERLALSPLIPYKLQRLHQVPGSHPESAEEERGRKTRDLFASAPHVEVTYTGTMAPALRPYVKTSLEGRPIWTGLTAAQSFPPVELDAREDNQAPVLIQSETVSGGSGIIKSQSQCPFKAFAEYRLGARGEDEATFGFDALERGKCAHTALEVIWEKLQTQSNLKVLSSNEVQALVEEAVAKAVQDDGSGPVRTLTSEAERERLKEVVSMWLELEKNRPVGFSVERVEQKLEIELSGLKLGLRVDRIDRLKNGSLLLIDYKTGLQTKTKLQHERPEEPQLLVYAAAVGEPVDGLYFAQLRSDGVKAVGHGTGKHFLIGSAVKDHKSEWDAFLTEAKETVHRLAHEFVQGHAAVNPLKSACSYCKVKPICRVGSGVAGDEDEE